MSKPLSWCEIDGQHYSVSHSLTQQQRQAAIRQWKQACDRWTLT